jgi:hypothetical protein
MSVGLFLLVFGLLGAAGGVGFLSTHSALCGGPEPGERC